MLFLKTIKNNLYILSVVFLCSCGNEAYEKIEVAGSKSEVIEIYKSYPNLNDDNDFIDACVTKLETYNLTQNEIDSFTDIIAVPTNINIIVVPDFSNRLTVKDNQDQSTKFDIPIIESGVFNAFYSVVAKKAKSQFKVKRMKDKLLLDLTDSKQAGGIFLNYVDSINIDFSLLRKDSPPKKYLDNRRQIFNQCISAIYKEAEKKPLGADYFTYFRDKLYKRIEKTTLKEKWVNKIIIITDGYLEPDSVTDYTNIYGNPQLKPIPKTGRNFNNCEVYICQINKRVKDRNANINVLKNYWKDWFISMNFKNVKENGDDKWWEPRNESTENAAACVAKFISTDAKTITELSPTKEETVSTESNVANTTSEKDEAPIIKQNTSKGKFTAVSINKEGMPRKANATKKADRCDDAYNDIYNLALNENMTEEDIIQLIKREDLFLGLSCSDEYNEIIKKSKQAFSESLKLAK